jgi:hypothetical protein
MKNWPKKAKVAWVLMVIAALAVAGYLIVDHFKPHVPQLEAGIGIWESEMSFVANPGGFEVATLTILNGRDQDRIFYVTLEQPNLNKLPNGYEAFPVEYYDWFTVPDEGIAVAAGGYYQVKIPILIPYDTTYMDRHAELMVQVTAADPAGLVQMGVASKWYIVVTATGE